MAILVQVMRSILWEPKRLFKTHIYWKKAIFSVKKCICPIFFRIVEIDKPQKTIQKSPKDILTFNVEVIGSFWGPKRLLKTQIFLKKAVFLRTNVFAPYFLKFSSVINLRKRFIRARKIVWQVMSGNKSFSSTWEVAENTNFFKKGRFPENKYICPIFSQIVECDQPQETIYKS